MDATNWWTAFVPSLEKTFNDLGIPMANPLAPFASNAPAYLEYWTAIMDWPPLQFLLWWALGNIVISFFAGLFAYNRILKASDNCSWWDKCE